MAALSDDDYWDSSQLEAFNFDENESFAQEPVRRKTDNYPSRKTNAARNETLQNQPEYLVPISVIINDKNLKKYLDDDKSPHKISDEKCLKVEETIRHITLDRVFNLSSYRSLNCKIKLLDEAILSADGNCILMVILHLVKTLKPSLVYDILKSRPMAYDHYMAHLTIRLNTSGITDLASVTDQNTFIGLKLYSILTKYYTKKESLDSLRKKLQVLYNHWFENASSNENDSVILKYYINLIGSLPISVLSTPHTLEIEKLSKILYKNWQLQAKTSREVNRSVDNSVNACLSSYCQKYWNSTADHPYSPHTLANKQGLTNKQIEWVFLISKTSSQSWEDISKQFIKSNWLGNKKVLNSLINSENIVIHLGTNNAPHDLLENILSMMDDRSKSISLAMKFKCHRHVINSYVQEKDRESLTNYKKKINPQSEEYFYAENALRSTVTKWKN